MDNSQQLTAMLNFLQICEVNFKTFLCVGSIIMVIISNYGWVTVKINVAFGFKGFELY